MHKLIILTFIVLSALSTAYSQKSGAPKKQAAKENPSKFIVEGNKALYESRFEDAINNYTKEINANPKKAAGYYARGNAYLFSYQFEQAIEDYTKALEKNTNFADALNNRGLCYSYVNKMDSALFDFDRLVRLDSNYSEAYLNRGNVYMTQDEYDKALLDFEKVVKLTPKNPSVYYQLGKINYRKGEYNAAIENYAKSEKLNYIDPDLFYQRGNTYFKMQNYKAAIEDYTKLLAVDSRHIHALNNRAVAYENLGFKEKANDDRKRISEIQGFLLPPKDSLTFFKYIEPNSGLTIELPADWNTHVASDVDKTVMTLSPEKLEANKPYNVGVKITREKNMNKKYGVLEPADIIAFWESSVIKNNMNYFKYDFIKRKIYEDKDGYKSQTNTTVLQYSERSEPLVFYEHLFVKADEIIYIYFQCPQYLGSYFEDIYEKAIKSITLPAI